MFPKIVFQFDCLAVTCCPCMVIKNTKYSPCFSLENSKVPVDRITNINIEFKPYKLEQCGNLYASIQCYHMLSI